MQEATIITDGVAQDAAGMDEQTATTEERGAGGEVTIQQAGSRAVPNGGEPSDVSGGWYCLFYCRNVVMGK